MILFRKNMQHDLNLSGDQVANITQVIDRYVDASNDLQKSIDDGTINPSSIESQKQQLKAAEEQGIAQYLRSDQLSQWNILESQGQKDRDTGQDDMSGDDRSEDDMHADEYSNLPKSNTPQN